MVVKTTFTGKYFKLILLGVIALITFIINQFPAFIEQYYSTGIYPYISRIERLLLGWVPFSIGDILYAFAVIWCIAKLVQFIRRWRKKGLNQRVLLNYGRKLLQIVLVIYISFNWLWGFNYNRLGSAYQMQLQFDRYSNEELVRLTTLMKDKMLPYYNDSAAFIPLQKSAALTQACVQSYTQAAKQFPFLQYRFASIKPHSFYTLGNYLGFMGYLNPFTAEAQMNTTIPMVFKPAVLCHEMGHQLGYASESEANFIAFISCRQSSNPAFRYSIYYDMFGYAISDLYFRDSITAKRLLDNLPDKIKRDRLEVRQFFRKYRNPVSPLIDWFYDKYLKLNSQPKGRESYNEVVGWMIAYARRYGWNAL